MIEQHSGLPRNKIDDERISEVVLPAASLKPRLHSHRRLRQSPSDASCDLRGVGIVVEVSPRRDICHSVNRLDVCTTSWRSHSTDDRIRRAVQLNDLSDDFACRRISAEQNVGSTRLKGCVGSADVVPAVGNFSNSAFSPVRIKRLIDESKRCFEFAAAVIPQREVRGQKASDSGA